MNITSFGAGNMGGGIGRRLLAAGHAVTVWDRSREKMQELASAGADLPASAHDAVRDAEVVVTSLLDDRSVLDSAIGPEGFAHSMQPGAIHLCVTTISPGCADRLMLEHARAGSRFVAGPVVGRPDSAASGQLMTYLAGDASALPIAADLSRAYAKKTVVVPGRAGLAYVMKLCANYTAISIIEIMGEAYAFADKAGLDRHLLGDFFGEAFAHPALKQYAAKLRDRDASSERGFPMTTGLKDVKLMLEASAAMGVRFEVGAIVQRKMLRAIESGLASADWSAIAEITRQESGLDHPEK